MIRMLFEGVIGAKLYLQVYVSWIRAKLYNLLRRYPLIVLVFIESRRVLRAVYRGYRFHFRLRVVLSFPVIDGNCNKLLLRCKCTTTVLFLLRTERTGNLIFQVCFRAPGYCGPTKYVLAVMGS